MHLSRSSQSLGLWLSIGLILLLQVLQPLHEALAHTPLASNISAESQSSQNTLEHKTDALVCELCAASPSILALIVDSPDVQAVFSRTIESFFWFGISIVAPIPSVTCRGPPSSFDFA